MSEIGEAVSAAVAAHSDAPECPFCPLEDDHPWTTYDGAANDSEKLKRIIDDPSQLTSLQPGARPKDDQPGRQRPDRAPQPEAIRHREQLWMTFQAHHLVSGNQALKGSAMEQWISAGAEGSRIEADTGYSVNNAANGAWLPSKPRAPRGDWGSKTDEARYAKAVEIMRELGAQIHIGPHNIDVEDLDGEHHSSYDTWLKEHLEAMARRIAAWAPHCARCAPRPSGKLKPSVRVNEALDRLSSCAESNIVSPPASWHVFISKYAYWYHAAQAHERGPRFANGAFEAL